MNTQNLFEEQGCFPMDMPTRIESHKLPADLKGRIVKPSVSVLSKEFSYTPAVHTNLAETFRKAKAKLEIASRD